MGQCCSPERQHQVQWAASCLGSARPRIGLCYVLSKVSAQINTETTGLVFIGHEVKHSNWISVPCRHNTYLQECTGQREPTYQLNIHDTKLLFLRFATEQSFSVDTGGGGRESNIHLIPYVIHTVLYVLNTYVFLFFSLRCCFSSYKSYLTGEISLYHCWKFIDLIFQFDFSYICFHLSTKFANSAPAVRGLRPERRRICRVSRSSRVRSGWKVPTRLKDHTISPSWPCMSCHPNGGGAHVYTFSGDSWSPHIPAKFLQSLQTSMALFLFTVCLFLQMLFSSLLGSVREKHS